MLAAELALAIVCQLSFPSGMLGPNWDVSLLPGQSAGPGGISASTEEQQGDGQYRPLQESLLADQSELCELWSH